MAETSNRAGLEFRGISKHYGLVRAVDNVDLQVPRGEFLTLLGPSGSGKTTMLMMIAGFISPTNGRILLDNGYALDANLDYRFRYHDQDGVRNDSDLRWRLAGSRAMGDDNLAGGFRGRVSYRGNGEYRNDYSLFVNYRYGLDEANQLSFGGEVRRRRYPEGPLRAQPDNGRRERRLDPCA